MQLHPGAALGALREVEAALEPVEAARAGTRIHGLSPLRPLLAGDGAIGAIAAAHLGPAAFPVRAILFNKTDATNWALPWHQDRTIAVAARGDVPGFGPWTVKQGLVHVAPPFALLARMVTIRLHLDPVDSENAPLLVAPGSQRTLVGEAETDAVAAACGTMMCLADPGDIWAYATPILHASPRAIRPRRRRVLQLDYAVDALPGRLCWLGV